MDWFSCLSSQDKDLLESLFLLLFILGAAIVIESGNGKAPRSSLGLSDRIVTLFLFLF